jgi:hypothetical protein
MNLNDFLQAAGGSKQFISENKFEEIVLKEFKAIPEILERLKHLEETPSESLRLEYFFYTNAAGKAKDFAACLKNRGFSANYSKVPGPTTIFLINGWTDKIKINTESVTAWSIEMCELGYSYDCAFDGWGTTPDQD